MTDPWLMPASLKGNPRLLRVSASLAGTAENTCPSYTAAKARPAVSARAARRHPHARLEDFSLGQVQTALDRVEFDGLSLDAALRDVGQGGRPLHDTQQTYIRHAVRTYLDNKRPRNAPAVVPCQSEWVLCATKDERTWEYVPWGRRYHDPATGLREFRFLLFGRAGERERPAAQIALAAHATGSGEPALRPDDHAAPYASLGAEVVKWVRVTEVGLLDGSYNVLFEGTPEKARTFFAKHAADRVRTLVQDGNPQPGASCFQCKLLTSCRELVKMPGLLGVPGRRAAWPLRKVSISDLRYYRDCPAKAYAYRCHLPRTDEYSDEARLGHAVHRVLEINHSGAGAGECNAHDMPMADQTWGEAPNVMSGELGRTGSRMLGWHLDICPFNSGPITDVRPEPELAFYDTAANVLVVAKPDLLYRDQDAIVWRETKTTQREKRFHDDPLDAYPQLALATVLLSEGTLGGDPAGARVELETLKPDTSTIEYIEPFQEPDRVAKARQVLHDLAEPWRNDEVFTARPSARACGTCPVSTWCSSAIGGDPS